jgi:hypothetical protein
MQGWREVRERFETTHEVSITPGEIELTLICFGPNSQARLRVICRTALLDVLYAIHGWAVPLGPCSIMTMIQNVASVLKAITDYDGR